MTSQMTQTNLRLHYTIMCEDVRVEINHKLSLMGIFYAIQVPQMPVTLLKLVILNHWSGEGQYLSEVRILTPDRVQPVAVSAPSPFQVPADGYADNVTIFANVTFPARQLCRSVTHQFECVCRTGAARNRRAAAANGREQRNNSVAAIGIDPPTSRDIGFHRSPTRISAMTFIAINHVGAASCKDNNYSTCWIGKRVTCSKPPSE